MFEFHELNNGHPSWEWLPTTAGTYKAGDAFIISGGNATTVSSGVGQDTDEGTHYIMVEEGTIATTGDLAPFIRCTPDIVWRTTLSADDADLAVGLKYCIHTDGRQHDGTTTRGCFTCTKFDGLTAGDFVYGTIV